MIANVIIIFMLITLVGAAIRYIRKARKNGAKCIGCPSAGCCSRNCPSKEEILTNKK